MEAINFVSRPVWEDLKELFADFHKELNDPKSRVYEMVRNLEACTIGFLFSIVMIYLFCG